MKTIMRQNMANHIVTIGIDETMEAAFRKMRENGVRHLPVISKSGDVIGMLSDRDVQRAMISTIEHDPRGRGVSETIEFDPEASVKDYMCWPVEALDQNTDIQTIAQRMISKKISSFLVSRGDKITGIVTTEDLLRVLVDVLADPTLRTRWTLNQLLQTPSSEGRDSTF